MLPSRMTRIDRKGLRNHSSIPILQMKCQRQLHSIKVGKTVQLVVSLSLIMGLLTQHVTAFDYEQKRIPSKDEFSYDYEDGFDPVLTFRKSQDQSMLGKGEKIGEEKISLTDSKNFNEIELSRKIHPDTADVSGYNTSMVNIADRHQQNIVDSNIISNSHLQGIDMTDTTDLHQRKEVSKDKHAPDEFGNVHHNFKHTSVLGTTLDKSKDKLVTRLTALSSTNNTGASGAPMSKQTQTNTSSDGQSWAIRLDYRQETSLEYNNTSREMNFGPYNNNRGTKDGSWVSNGAMAFGNSKALENMSKSSAPGKPIIYIAGLFPWTEDIPAGAVGRGVLPAVHIALDHVNTDAHRNRKYILNMAYNDTRVSIKCGSFAPSSVFCHRPFLLV